MEDRRIVALYWQRSEEAIHQTQLKYGSYCYMIASNILASAEDARECVNDTYLAAWNAIPPHRPTLLSTFLGKLTRRISIDRWRQLSAEKRGGGTVPLALEELKQCIPGGEDPAMVIEAKVLSETINRFLDTLPQLERRIFLLRYFELTAIKDLQARFSMSESKLKSMLHRTRKKLRHHLEKEGY